MGESDRYQDFQQYKKSRRSIFLAQGDNALFWLLTVNVMLFLILLFIQVGYGVSDHDNIAFNSQVLPNFQLPGRLMPLSEKPWTLLIYNFSDVFFLRILGNMLWLWAFGSIMQGLTGNRKLFPVFIYGGLAGAVFFIAGNYIFPHAAGGYLFGANTGVMAIAAAATLLEPNYRIFSNINGGIPLWILFVIYFVIAILGMSAGGGPYLLSVLGAASAGALFVIFLHKGKDASAWMNNLYQWFCNLFTPGKKDKNTSVKEKVFYNTGSRTPFSRSANITQQRIDDILDKISQDGFASLSDEEKKILKRASEDEGL
ncbi:MAG: rhomboid family intramembrane serine protease [Ferruginibacter sp.]